jgi:hypothetical protein
MTVCVPPAYAVVFWLVLALLAVALIAVGMALALAVERRRIDARGGE